MLSGTLCGNVGGDAEMRYAPSGEPVMRFNVASNYNRRNAQGEWEQRVEWVRVVVFGKRAESLSEHNLITKGTKVCIMGRIEAQPWTTNDDEVRAGLQMIAQEVELMGTGGSTGGGGDKGWGNDMTGQPSRRRDKPADDEEVEGLPF